MLVYEFTLSAARFDQSAYKPLQRRRLFDILNARLIDEFHVGQHSRIRGMIDLSHWGSKFPTVARE